MEKHPEEITVAANKIFEMVNNFKDVMTQIDREMIERWVKDFQKLLKHQSYCMKR